MQLSVLTYSYLCDCHILLSTRYTYVLQFQLSSLFYSVFYYYSDAFLVLLLVFYRRIVCLRILFLLDPFSDLPTQNHPFRRSDSSQSTSLAPPRHPVYTDSSSSSQSVSHSTNSSLGYSSSGRLTHGSGYHPHSNRSQTSFNLRSGRSMPMAGMMDVERARSRRERTFVGTECAICEEPLEHTLRGERVLQFSCGHVSHEACFYEYIKEFDSQYCPTCSSPLGLDSTRGGNVLNLGILFFIFHFFFFSNFQFPSMLSGFVSFENKLTCFCL